METKELAKIEEMGQWYSQLVTDCQYIIAKAEAASRWALVKGYHQLGERIVTDKNLEWHAKGNQSYLSGLSNNIGILERTLYRAIQFYRQYPQLDMVPEGENISWNKLLTKYLPHVARNTGDNEWYTPSPYIEAARQVMGGIDCDPASSEKANEIVQATTHFTAQEDGRQMRWTGNVWLNPPYAQPLVSDFCELLVQKYQSGEIQQACVLVNNATETIFYQNMLKSCAAVCFLRGRVKFVDEKGAESGTPLQGQTILYFGNNRDTFAQCFGNMGVILYAT